MINRRLTGTLSLLVFLLAIASVSSTLAFSASDVSMVPRIRAGSDTSTNWSGYAITGSQGSVTYVAGSWIVPAVTASAANSYSSFWVGIDGFNSGTVEQIGTDSDWVNGAPQYYAWFEFYPKASYLVNTITVQPGDVMSANVQYSHSRFTVSITDGRTGQSFSTSAKVSSAQRSSAEWIAEAPSSGGVLPLANFGTVLFGNDYTLVAQTCFATIGGATGPIGSFDSASIQQIAMVDSSNSIIASPSTLSTDKSSFSVERVNSGGGTAGSLAVSVSTDKPSYKQGSSVYITVSVTDSTSTMPIAGASVTVSAAGPGGLIASGTGTTNSNGLVTFKLRLSPRTPTGTYSVQAIATANGYNQGLGLTNFQVT